MVNFEWTLCPYQKTYFNLLKQQLGILINLLCDSVLKLKICHREWPLRKNIRLPLANTAKIDKFHIRKIFWEATHGLMNHSWINSSFFFMSSHLLECSFCRLIDFSCNILRDKLHVFFRFLLDFIPKWQFDINLIRSNSQNKLDQWAICASDWVSTVIHLRFC